MAGPSPNNRTDELPANRPSTSHSPQYPPRQASTRRPKAPTLNNAGPPVLPPVSSLRRSASNQNLISANHAGRPSLSPGSISRQGSVSQAAHHPVPARSNPGLYSNASSRSAASGAVVPTGYDGSSNPTPTSSIVSSASTLINGSPSFNQRRMQSGTDRRFPSYNAVAQGPSMNGYATGDSRVAIGEFAQRHLFAQFEYQANAKIEDYINPRYNQVEIHIDKGFGPRADPQFDQLLQAIGHSASKNPKSFLDKVTIWHDRVIEPAATQEKANNNGTGLHHDAQQERRASLAIYLLCRALLEILRQTSDNPLKPQELSRVEDLVYRRRFRALCREGFERSPVGQAKWDLLTQVIGVLFDIDFPHMSETVLHDLNSFQQVLGTKGNRDARDAAIEAEAVLYLKGLRTIKLKYDSEIAWNQSRGFLDKLSKLFDDVHGQVAKEAYCRFLGAILLPVAGSPKTDFLELSWKKLVSHLSDRLGQLASKPKYWQAAAPTQAILACISPTDLFMARFQNFVNALPAKLRERTNRATAVKAVCRLVWAYLRRTKDSHDQVIETLSNVIKLVFFSGRRYSLSREPAIAEPLVQLIRIIGHRHQDLCFRSIIFPMLNADQLSPMATKDLRPEHLDADKSVIGIRACLALLSDVETTTEPPFPLSFDDEYSDSRLQYIEPRLRGPRLGLFSQFPSGQEHFTVPIATDNFSETLKIFLSRFSDLIIKIVQICDTTYGGQASIDDRIVTSAVPKTPLAGGFNRKDEVPTLSEERSTFLDLLHVGIAAIPRCASNRFAMQAIASCLCNSTIHLHNGIAFASTHALKSLARQGHAQLIIAQMLGFVLNYDHRCAVAGPLGVHAGTFEHTLRLYVDLLKTWVMQIDAKTSNLTTTISPLTQRKFEQHTAHSDTATTNAQIDRIESQALFFLCSGSPRVRSIARDILKMVVRLDELLSQDRLRIATMLEAQAEELISPEEDALSIYDKSILIRNVRNGESNSIFTLCCSLGEDDKFLWYMVLPRLLDMLQRSCPSAVAQARDDVCIRLNQMQPLMEGLDDRFRTQQQSSSIDMTITRHSRQFSSGSADGTINQWKGYLMFACKTLTRTATPVHDTAQEINHTRRSSKSSQSTQDSFSTSWDLFQKVMPFLSASNASLREAAVYGLGSINVDLLRPLLECIGEFEAWYGEWRRHLTSHYRTTSSPRRQQPSIFSPENAHILQLVSHFLTDKEILRDAYVCQYFQKYVETLSRWLHEAPNESTVPLRIAFCGIVENVWRASRSAGAHTPKLMEPWTRLSAFTIMEEWTGLIDSSGTLSSQPQSPSSYLSRSPTINSRTMIKEQETLNKAAMASMAVLCDGPLNPRSSSTAHDVSFNIERLMLWIHGMFTRNSDKANEIGRRALTSIILQNRDERLPAEITLENFYEATTTRCLKSYLEVTLVTFDHLMALVGRPKILTALLYTLANSDGSIRTLSARLLRALDENRVRDSVKDGNNEARPCNVQEYDMSISDRTTAVYKKANFDLTLKLSRAFSSQSDLVFAEFSKNFQKLKANTEGQRSFVHAILPWLTEFELQVSEAGDLTAPSYMMLMNLMEITLNYSAPLQHEIQALWQALVSHNKGNISIILTFTMDLTLEKRNPALVEVARQIIVFMSTTRTGEQLRTALLQQIVPSKMESDERQTGSKMQALYEAAQRYAHIGQIPLGHTDPQHPWDMTAGQLSLILLVDLIVAPQAKDLPKNSIPPILQAVLVLWDHKIPIVQEQAREMLVHLIHELVITRYTAEVQVPQEIENFIDLLRRRDKSVSWSYAENERADKGYELSQPFQFVIKELLRSFATIHPTIDEAWGQATLHWALNCRVLHLALRSLQVYRCIVKPLNQKTVADLVRVLATLVADDEPEKQSFAIEAMRTIRAILYEVDPNDAPVFRLLFWTVGAWLGVGKETEFEEGLIMLDIILSKFDLNDEATCKTLIDSMPAKLQWLPGELTSLILRGCRSSKQLDHTLKILNRLIQAPSNELIGGQERLLYVTLANLPRFVQLSTDEAAQTDDALDAAQTLVKVASRMGIPRLANELEQLFTRQSAPDSRPARMTAALGAAFFPANEYQSLVFVMGLLTNNTSGMQKATLVVLDCLTEHVNMRNPQISSAGPDLVSPLLRLLQTELCPLALKVLDKFSAIMSSTTSMPSQLLISMADHRSAPIVRKTYDDAQSLFGIPEKTGWSVPMPAQLKASTRDNLMAVANMYSDSSLEATAALPTPEVEFQREDATPDSYFPLRANALSAEEVNLAEANMGELASKLDNLDDFFGEDDADADTIAESASLARSPADLTPTTSFSSQPTAYDSFSSGPHLHHKSSPSGHARSHQSSISQAKLPASPRQPVMSPSAFNPNTPPTTRPSMPSRSITSPPVPQPTPPDKTFLVTNREVEPFSDDDVLVGGTASDASSVFDGSHRMPRTRSIRDGLNNVKKRLTSGKHTITRGRNQHLEDSPEVPKLPDVYRQASAHGPKTAQP